MIAKDYLLLFSPLIAAALSSYLTYVFAIKSKHKATILKFKEEKYSNLLVLLQGFGGKTANSETKRLFFKEQYRSWLYASDEVVEAINEMVTLVRKAGPDGRPVDQEKGRKTVGNIVLAMRKDMIGKTNLSYECFKYIDVI